MAKSNKKTPHGASKKHASKKTAAKKSSSLRHIKEGMRVKWNTRKGVQHGKVIKINKNSVLVDCKALGLLWRLRKCEAA